MTTPTLASQIAGPFCDFLAKNGFREIYYDKNEKFFGNETMEFVSGEYCLRFVTDRGDFLVDISPVDKSKWFTLDSILLLLGYSMAGRTDAEIVGILQKENDRLVEFLALQNRN